MSLATVLIQTMIPLYVMVLLGFIAGKFLQAEGKNMANIIFYMLIPTVVFDGVWRAELTPAMLLLPFAIALVSTVACVIYLKLSRLLLSGGLPNMVALSAGVANVGYFGVPIAVVLFDEQTAAIYILAIFGPMIFQNSVGFYVSARGNHTARDALLKVLKIPTLYCAVLAAMLSFANVEQPTMFVQFAEHMRGAYVVLGMMVIGVGLSRVKHFAFDWSLIALTFSARFVVWPALIGLFVWFDHAVLGWYGASIYPIFMLMSVVPMASDTVSIATILEVHPEKMAAAVMLSTLFALVYMPLVLPYLLRL